MKNKFKFQISFEKQLIGIALLITSLPLIFSYANLLFSSLVSFDEKTKSSMLEVADFISEDDLIQKKLENKENDGSIQLVADKIIESFKNVDIIVICDMTGEKYSHVKLEQIGDIFIGEDKKEVLEEGASYYSLKEGSVGTTLRWFQPIYSEGKQVGFVMIGKNYSDMVKISSSIKIKYMFQTIIALSIALVVSKSLAKKIKKAMHNMDPYEISKLYGEKKVILNTVSEGVIALNKEHQVTEVNKNCYKLINGFDIDKVTEKLSNYIKERREFEMKEFIIQGEKIFISIKNIMDENIYLGAVITLINSENINRVAKEITGVDEVVKNLRANVHEFKNTLYVILGLLQMKKYSEAEDYILKIKEVKKLNSNKFSSIEDYYVRALLLSRELVAKERKIKLELEEESFLFREHSMVSSLDLVTIVGNLIENAFEACSKLTDEKGRVAITFYEDEDSIEIQVEDNGEKINGEIRERIFVQGVSSKGENRGTGLALVKNRVDLYNGKIEIDEFKKSKVFVITIYKEDQNEKSSNY
ncbi:MAG: ATP-binding protein [Clostridium sp.]